MKNKMEELLFENNLFSYAKTHVKPVKQVCPYGDLLFSDDEMHSSLDTEEECSESAENFLIDTELGL
jgi:hypothetical protein